MRATRTTTTRTTPTTGAALSGARPVTVTTEDTYAAYVACRKGKRTAVSCIEFETDLVANLARLTRQINDCTWHPQSHMCFVVLNPKPREIWASPFADRVVHHVAYRALRHRFEPHWIASTFACIPGRGTGAACQWAQDAARKVTAGWSRPAWVLQADIANCFPSIDRSMMADMLLERSPEPWLRHLVNEVVNVDVTDGAHFPGDPTLLDMIPAHKSLWHAPRGKGLPIGNLTSQFGANVYLDRIDQAVVRGRWALHYGRYVDDMVLLDQSQDRLKLALANMTIALNRLGLHLHPGKTHIKPVTAGFDFAGRFVLPHRSYLRRATVRRAADALKQLDSNPHPAETVTSYLALARQVNGYKLRQSLAYRASATVDVDAGLTVASLPRETTGNLGIAASA